MISVPSPNHFWFTVGGEVPSHEIGGTPPALAGPGQRPAPLLLAGRQVLLAHQLRLVHGLRDGGELELTTPITNEFNPPPPAVRFVRSGTGLRRKCLYPDPAARTPATCGRVPDGPPGR